ncbi:MAG TPA: alpha/beta hydrolase [Azospirillum sp.]|nr:alpha/beta hydrolase [Azospirillum sp.]
MPVAAINGVELHWELSGEEGAPVVLVHGSWGDHSTWDRIVPALAPSMRVLTYDRRGHSRSERPAMQGSVREDVADLAALIEHLNLAPAHILGGSFGGSIVLRLAAERPDLFRSLLVHEPPLFGVLEDPAARKVLQIFQERVHVVIELLEEGRMEDGARRFVETIAFGPGAWEQLPGELRQTFIFNAPTFLDEQRDPEWLLINLQALANFPAPALLTQGTQSETFFPLVVEKIAQFLPHSQRQTLPGADHVPQLSRPEEYVEAILSFIRAVAGAGLSRA